MTSSEKQNLIKIASNVRINTIDAIANLGVGHIGGSLSIVDVLTLLYWKHMNVDCKNPKWKERDRLVLSKGHSGPALYSVLAMKGFFPLDWLYTLNQGGTKLPSHCDRTKTPGIDMSTGSLGQGLSCACGIAFANRLDKLTNKVFVIIGDGECDEGQNWEAAMFATHNKLSNLIVFIDNNKMQIDGLTHDVLSLENLDDKWKSFGFFTQRVDGHDFEKMDEAICKAKEQTEKPSAIILDTIKGKGAEFCEGKLSNHNMNVSREQADIAIAKLKIIAEAK